jgi:uncharacterized protein YjbI with pentapeptide repeats
MAIRAHLHLGGPDPRGRSGIREPSYVSLPDADFRGRDLAGVDYNQAQLWGANFARANLFGADLSGSDLRGADLTGADLRGADLSYTDLRGANLSGADLTGCDVTEAYFDEDSQGIPIAALARMTRALRARKAAE